MLEARACRSTPSASSSQVANRRKGDGRHPLPPQLPVAPLDEVTRSESTSPQDRVTPQDSISWRNGQSWSSSRQLSDKTKGRLDRANRKVMKIAIHTLLQGEASRHIRETLLSSLEGEALRHDDRLLVLFRGIHSGRHAFRALYSLRDDKWTRIVHLLPSPPFIDSDMCLKFFRFDCAQREFKELEGMKSISGVVDAVFLRPQFLKSKLVTYWRLFFRWDYFLLLEMHFFEFDFRLALTFLLKLSYLCILMTLCFFCWKCFFCWAGPIQ